MAFNIKQDVCRAETQLTQGELNALANEEKIKRGLKACTQASFNEKLKKGTMQVKELDLYLDIMGFELKVVEKDNK